MLGLVKGCYTLVSLKSSWNDRKRRNKGQGRIFPFQWSPQSYHFINQVIYIVFLYSSSLPISVSAAFPNDVFIEAVEL